MELNALQEKINAKAEERLKKDINDYLIVVNEWTFAQHLERLKTTIDGKEINFRELYWPNTGQASKILFKEMLPLYVDEETEAFMQKVNDAQAQIDEIKDQINN